MRYRFQISFAAVAAFAMQANATMTVFTNRDAWLKAVGAHEFIGFTEYPEFTIITDQYSEQGITFTDGNDFIFTTNSFPTDGSGLVSSDGSVPAPIHMSFAIPRFAFALEHTGTTQVFLHGQGTLLFTSQQYVAGFFPFIGFVSTTPFDQAVAVDPIGTVVTLDNVYFGIPVPSPSALAFLAIGAVASGTRWRRR